MFDLLLNLLNRAGFSGLLFLQNFGEMGRRPTHPELLDHLALSLIENGWSTKRLIRKIVLSSTYRMSSTGAPGAIEVDPQNRTHTSTMIWIKFNVKISEAENVVKKRGQMGMN